MKGIFSLSNFLALKYWFDRLEFEFEIEAGWYVLPDYQVKNWNIATTIWISYNFQIQKPIIYAEAIWGNTENIS